MIVTIVGIIGMFAGLFFIEKSRRYIILSFWAAFGLLSIIVYLTLLTVLPILSGYISISLLFGPAFRGY
jgi:predicted membrane channel-forming protein YqfA (hemolysin III family)